MGINKYTCSGNLTRDAEERVTNGGMTILSFTVAVNDRRKNPQNGEWQDYPNYVPCVMFGKRAEAIAGYLKKGVKVCIEGKLRQSKWESDGETRSKIEVVIDEIELMSRQAQPVMTNNDEIPF